MAGPTDLARASFELQGWASTAVLFGDGRVADLDAVLEGLGLSSVVLIDGLEQPQTVASVRTAMGARYASSIDRVREHVPASDVERAVEHVRARGADGLVALGGGSATGLAKAITLTEQLPIVAIPTTYAGSEVTSIWGVTEGGRKTTGVDERVRPRVVIYDPELTWSLPPRATAASGMNAVAHCVEALWTEGATPLSDAVAGEGIALLAAGLREAVGGGDARAGRATALRGAWLGGVALATAGTALHHKLCHVLGGLGLPHAAVHAAVLPAVAEFLLPAAPRAGERIARALGAGDGPAGLRGLARALGADATLAELGLTATQASTAAELTAKAAPWHPRPATADDVLLILRSAGAPTD